MPEDVSKIVLKLYDAAYLTLDELANLEDEWNKQMNYKFEDE
jgi:hypothetical protein